MATGMKKKPGKGSSKTFKQAKKTARKHKSKAKGNCKRK